MTAEQIGEEYLEHYGVKGMKWGIRRSPVQLARARKSRRNRPETKAKKMSDAELKGRVDRLRLEREYVRITQELEPKGPVKNLLAKHGAQAASIAVSATTSAIVGAALKNKFNAKKDDD